MDPLKPENKFEAAFWWKKATFISMDPLTLGFDRNFTV
jgi:hypothetical protein